jgi:hypothetical protein
MEDLDATIADLGIKKMMRRSSRMVLKEKDCLIGLPIKQSTQVLQELAWAITLCVHPPGAR